jgi:hypothetical protein
MDISYIDKYCFEIQEQKEAPVNLEHWFCL